MKRMLLALALALSVATVAPSFTDQTAQAAAQCAGPNHFDGNGGQPKHDSPACK